MTDKLTDKDIIKALPNMTYGSHYCLKCKYDNGKGNDRCGLKGCKIARYALDLITRQWAKIDEFMKETAVTTLLDDAVVYTPTLEDYNKFKKKFKSEAAKEFAEKIKEFMHNKFKALDEYEFEYITERDIDNLVKETVGEDNAKM